MLTSGSQAGAFTSWPQPEREREGTSPHTPAAGTVLLVMPLTANPASAAISTAGLPLDVRAAFAALLEMPSHVSTTEALRSQLGVTDYRFRKVRRHLAKAGLLVHHSETVEGVWRHVYAVTDTPGTLPGTDELRELARRFREGGPTESGIAGHPGTSIGDGQAGDEPGQDRMSNLAIQGWKQQRARAESTSGPTGTDSELVRENRDVEDQRQTGSRFRRRGEAEAGECARPGVEDARAGQGAPVQPVPGDRNGKRPPVSVVGSLPALERLAKLPERERPNGAGPLWISNRDCLKLARTLPDEVVTAGLGVLGELELPFWFAPKVWQLIASGWSTARLRELFTSRLEDARSVWAVCERRLERAVPDAPGGLPVDEPEQERVLPIGEQINAAAYSWPEPEPVPGTAPWDMPRSEWRKSQGGAPAYEITRRQMEAVDPGEPSFDNDHMRDCVALMRRALASR